MRIEPEGPRGRVLKISGELDVATAPDLQSALEGLTGTPGDIRLDVSGLEFMDSSGLKVLVFAARSLGERGRLVLVHPSPPVARVLELSGLATAPNIEVEPVSREP